MPFNYKTSTFQELLEHINKSASATISVAKAYHTEHNNMDVVERINQCRKILKQRRITHQLTALCSETSQYGNNSQPTSFGVDRPAQEPTV